MDDMIKVSNSNIGGQEINSVNLRDVWAFVESKREFSHWSKDRLEDFCKGVDFLEDIIVTQYNQVDRIEYVVTLDTAKHICMIERNEKGRV